MKNDTILQKAGKSIAVFFSAAEQKLLMKLHKEYKGVITKKREKKNSSFPLCRKNNVLYKIFGVKFVIVLCFSTFAEKREQGLPVRCRGRVVKAMD